MATIVSGKVRRPAGGKPLSPSVRVFVAGIALLVLALSLVAARYYYAGLTPVRVVVDGVERTVRTDANDGARLLARLGYELRPEDRVTLPADGSIVLERARPVRLLQSHFSGIVWTRAETVGALLAEQNIALQSHDRIELDKNSVTAETVLPATAWVRRRGGLGVGGHEEAPLPIDLRIRRAVPFVVVDGDAVPAKQMTTASTVGAALSAAEVRVYQGDAVFPALDSRLQPGQRIVISRSTPIRVTADGKTLATRTQRASVGDALAELGVMAAGLDRVFPPLDTALRPHVEIKITRVHEDVVYEEQHTPFQTVVSADDSMAIDTQRVANAGVEGVYRKRFRIRSEDGVEVARELEDDWMAAEPQNRVIAYGRKIEPNTLETPEGPITYWRKIRVYTTSYSPARSGTPSTAAWYGRTRIGLPLAKGIVAVDPSLIPLRSQMYIPGYGIGLAGDTGGGVLGKFIDLGFDDANYQSWHWWTDIYLLWPPPPSYAIQYILPNYPRFPDRRR